MARARRTRWLRPGRMREDPGHDAKFCSGCGAAIGKTKPCPSCGEMNDPDARFCNECGTRYP